MTTWRILWCEEYPRRRTWRDKPDSYRFGVSLDGRREPIIVTVRKGPDAVDRARQAIDLAVQEGE